MRKYIKISKAWRFLRIAGRRDYFLSKTKTTFRFYSPNYIL